jgi:L-ascorbate metabolism protein UlaG (beta-lactamase superfamily)
MELHWLGHACFRIRGKGATIVTDPYADAVGKLGRPTADVVTISHEHPGHNNAAGVSLQGRLVRGPGEYDVRGVAITGVQTAHDAAGGRERGRNVVYAIYVDDISICHLGDLGHLPTAEQVEAIGRVDVLLLPVGPRARLSSTEASEVVNLLDPRIVVPMHHQVSPRHADAAAVGALCRELGATPAAAQARLALTAETLPEERRVVALEVRRAADFAAGSKAA